jgi:hypothetical protein
MTVGGVFAEVGRWISSGVNVIVRRFPTHHNNYFQRLTSPSTPVLLLGEGISRRVIPNWRNITQRRVQPSLRSQQPLDLDPGRSPLRLDPRLLEVGDQLVQVDLRAIAESQARVFRSVIGHGLILRRSRK